MSSSVPGARLTPHQSGCMLCAITHANPLCLFLQTKASLTSMRGPCVELICLICGVCCSFWIRPNKGFCHGSRVVRNCVTMEFWYSRGRRVGGRPGIGGIGRLTLWWWGSCGVTGGPWKVLLVGTVSANQSWVHVVLVGIAARGVADGVAWCNNYHPWKVTSANASWFGTLHSMTRVTK